MKTGTNSKFPTVDAYFNALPAASKAILKEYRKIIKEIVPAAEELISYNMPAFKMNGMLVWYAAYQNHIGLYPKPQAIVAFKNELKNYKTSKGAIQFPVDAPIPVTLVKKIVRYRVKENNAAAKLKIKK